jgi:hypothetical protein
LAEHFHTTKTVNRDRFVSSRSRRPSHSAGEVAHSSVRAIAQLQRTLNQSPRVTRLAHLADVLQRRGAGASHSEAVLQRMWDLEGALEFLRKTPAGQAAVYRILNGELVIHHHAQNESFTKYLVEDGRVVESDRPLTMNGFGDAEIVHVSDEMDAIEAAAMIVHESTHSIQKQPGGMVALWKESPVETRASRGAVELDMEFEAHMNQYQYELEVGRLSDKARQCLNAAGKAIDPEKVRAQIRRLYRTEAVVGDLATEAKRRTAAGQKAALKRFLAAVIGEYTAAQVREILVAMHKRRDEKRINPYPLDMPAYGTLSKTDPHTGLPPGALPYIL